MYSCLAAPGVIEITARRPSLGPACDATQHAPRHLVPWLLASAGAGSPWTGTCLGPVGTTVSITPHDPVARSKREAGGATLRRCPGGTRKRATGG